MISQIFNYEYNRLNDIEKITKIRPKYCEYLYENVLKLANKIMKDYLNNDSGYLSEVQREINL